MTNLVNTLLVQQVLAEPAWTKKLTDEDRGRHHQAQRCRTDSTASRK
jgi:hypothetical protein